MWKKNKQIEKTRKIQITIIFNNTKQYSYSLPHSDKNHEATQDMLHWFKNQTTEVYSLHMTDFKNLPTYILFRRNELTAIIISHMEV